MPSLLKNIKQSDNLIKTVLIVFSLVFVVVAFYFDSPQTIFEGFKTLAVHPGKLITDYVVIVGWGTTLMNAGLLMLISISFIHYLKLPINGIAIAAIFLMGGFGMFGKNIFNIWSIIFGVYLYSCFTKTKFSRYIYIAFFGTALVPLITEMALFTGHISLGVLVGVLIGFLLPPISTHGSQVHQGYNLYNVGFAAGLIGTIIISIMRSFGYQVETSLHWYDAHRMEVIILIYLVFLALVVIGWGLEKNIIQKYRHVLTHSGRLVADFTVLDGIPVVLFNMGLLGMVYTSYVLLVGGVLNGPTIGGIFTIVGFAGFGKHIKNTIPIVVGVALGTVVKIWNINDPGVLLGALFGTGLAPIAGQFGTFAGIAAGFIHLSLVLVTSSLHAGTSLYNNGFSAGIVALFLVPIIEMFRDEKERREEENETYEEEAIEDYG